MKIIYLDGVFDLFHRGHLESLRYIKETYPKSYLLVGIVDDKTCEGYKRKPIIPEQDRLEIVKSIKYVDNVLFPAPLIMTEEFIKKYDIDLIVHGFANDSDAKKQEKFFKIPIKIGKFQRIPYYSKTSTTDIINSIKNNYI